MRIVLDLQGAQSDSRFRGIGRYSLALAKAIAREAGEHEVWLALSGRFVDSIEPLRARFANLVPAERIRVFELPGPVAELDPANTWRMQAAELLREKFLADLRPDIVHMSTLFEGFHNEVVASVGRLDGAVPTAVTLYDLIPMLHPEKYDSDAVARRAYLRRAQSLKRAELLLAISTSSAHEAINTLDILPNRIATIGAGVNPWFRQVEITPDAKGALMTRCGLQRPFVLYTGLADPHKNLERLIVAFGLLPEEVRREYQLAIVGKLHEEDRKRLLSLGQKQGLNNGEVVCVGYVSDDDMRLLYNACALFVLPSLHEGFGLPLLEAMACGAPVIGSNCTSIPEIVDREDALFDPEQPRDIARQIAEVLLNAALRQSLKAWGLERAKAFTWETCARKALRAFEALHAGHQRAQAATLGSASRRRPLLAFVAPLPPEPTWVAGYSAKLLPNLARHYEIVCIVDQLAVSDPWINAEFPIRDVRWFESNARNLERVLYQFGNSPSHKHMFDLLERHPGVVVLHDFYLTGVLNWMEQDGYATGSYTEALYASHGFSALARDLAGREASMAMFPCNAAVLRSSIGTIVHSNNEIELARKWYGANASDLMRQAPILLSDADPPQSPANLREVDHSHVHHPERIANLYRDIIEELYAVSPQAREQELLKAVARAHTPASPPGADLAAVAAALTANRERSGPQQILVDVSVLAKHDARTGIQRVTRAILTALIADPPPGYRIEPIRAVGAGYLYARRFTSQCLALPENSLTDDAVEAGPGDIFLGVDWCAEEVPSLKQWFLEQRRHRTRIVFIAYDLLPLLQSEFFPPDMQRFALEWINTVLAVADGVACISRTVADEFCQWLADNKPERPQPLSLGFFHLGADLHSSLPTGGLSQDASAILANLRSRPSFLMVGTVEPRKGHRQALAAMEQLWADGVDANLAIIGQEGWMIDDLPERIRQHPERDNRLFWLEGISDEMLEEVYRSARALLVASQGEGFGLPLIEAAQYGLAIIARDIPVFREVAGEHAYYFRGDEAPALANALRAWLSLGDAAPTSAGIAWLTWKESSRQLLDVVLSERWHRSWPDVTHIPRSSTVAGNSEPIAARHENAEQITCE